MNENKYIVVRKKQSLGQSSGGMGSLSFEPKNQEALDSGNDVEVIEEALTGKEYYQLRQDTSVQAIAPSMPLNLISPVDSFNVSELKEEEITWGVEAVGAADSPFSGEGVVVAVLDTGIDPQHPAFSGVDLVQKNFTSEEDHDVDGHGTHCAGTIFGQDVEGMRMGVAPGVSKALIGKVLGESGSDSLTIANAIQWASTEGAHIISMSLGIDFPGYVEYLVSQGQEVPQATSQALEAYRANIELFSVLAKYVQRRDLFGQGGITIAAAGNERRPNNKIAVAPPAASANVISVGALEESSNGLNVAGFSNTQVDIAAPGVGIVSAAPGGGLIAMSGTSMATPHVAGVAALWGQRLLEQHNYIESDVLSLKLIASGSYNALSATASEEYVGTGLVKAP